MIVWTRRAVVGAAVGGLLVGVPAHAEIDEPARTTHLDALRRAFVGFDLLELAQTVLGDLRLDRWLPDLQAALADREHARGARSMRELGDDDVFVERVEALGERMRHHLGTRLRLRHLARAAPQTPEDLRAAVGEAHRRWFGIDLAPIRDHLAAYPEGLLVAVGPPTRLSELVASVGREPFLAYLELVHRRRARVWVANADPLGDLLAGLLDPAIRVVAFVGHGSWDSFSTAGLAGDPSEALLRACTELRRDPSAALPRVAEDDLFGLVGRGSYRSGSVDEEDLAALVRVLYGADRLPQPKELVVRYTCGVGRYVAEGSPRLLWELLPDELERQHLWGGAVSARRPEDEGVWEPELQAWLADKHVVLRERPALGTCLVAGPEDTRGYAGDSWLPDFVEEPIPAYQPPYPFAPARADEGG